MYFSSILGLVTKHDPHTENGGSFFQRYLVLKLRLSLPITRSDLDVYTFKMSKAKVSDGLYLRSAEHQSRTVSQDELGSFIGTSHILGTFHGEQVWNCLVKRWLSYPATGTPKRYNPGSYYPWALLSGARISFLFAPWYALNLLISSNKPKVDTSSKLIYSDDLYLMKDLSLFATILHKYFEWRMTLMYGKSWIKELFAIYFNQEELDHPLIFLSRRL